MINKRDHPGKDWLADEWNELCEIQTQLSDRAFLEKFKPIHQTFLNRELSLAACAVALDKIYKPISTDGRQCKIMEPASGTHVFGNIMKSHHYDVVGVEKADAPTARYCQLLDLPTIKPVSLFDLWTEDSFDLIVPIALWTKPNCGTDFGKQIGESVCKNIFYQISQDAELVLFDLRFMEIIQHNIQNNSLPFTWEHYKDAVPDGEFVVFRQKDKISCFRREQEV